MITPVSSASTQSASSATQVQAKPAGPSAGANGAAPASAAGSNIGPAVIVNLSGAGKNDMPQGDPDHDGH